MALKNCSELMSQLGRGESESRGDADLVQRFLVHRDEEAFAAIVSRHGDLVWGICQRVTGHYHLAEDAFQAVFMVLAAKAGSIRPPSVLPGWLHGVAVRTALRARTMDDRRRRRESLTASLAQPVSKPIDPVESAEMVAMLDEEIANLSDSLRTVVVLCELQGCSRKQASEQLGISEGTISSRLAAARKKLAERLSKRGMAAFSISAAIAGSGRSASAIVPAELEARAIAAAISPGGVSSQVSQLSNGVIRTMFIQKLKRVLVLALALPVLLGGVLIASEQAANSQPTPQKQLALADPPKPESKPADPQSAAAAKSQATGLGRLMVVENGDGQEWRKETGFPEHGRQGVGRFLRHTPRKVYIAARPDCFAGWKTSGFHCPSPCCGRPRPR